MPTGVFQHKFGNEAANWKGGRIDIMGYWCIYKPDHPRNSKGYVMEHRLIYEDYHKCMLLPWIEIHHVNGDIKDNRIENLQPLTRVEHQRITHMIYKSKHKCVKCGTNKTYIVKRSGLPHWRRGMCNRCYGRWFKYGKTEKR